MTQEKIEDWEKEFEEKVSCYRWCSDFDKDEQGNEIKVYRLDGVYENDIKSFIRQKLAERDFYWLKKIEEVLDEANDFLVTESEKNLVKELKKRL